MTFKIGDKVRRKKEYQTYGWNHGNDIIVIKEVTSTGGYRFRNVDDSWDAHKFELVEELKVPKLYTPATEILVKTPAELKVGMIADGGPRFEILNEGFNWVYVSCGGISDGKAKAQMTKDTARRWAEYFNEIADYLEGKDK